MKSGSKQKTENVGETNLGHSRSMRQLLSTARREQNDVFAHTGASVIQGDDNIVQISAQLPLFFFFFMAFVFLVDFFFQ